MTEGNTSRIVSRRELLDRPSWADGSKAELGEGGLMYRREASSQPFTNLGDQQLVDLSQSVNLDVSDQDGKVYVEVSSLSVTVGVDSYTIAEARKLAAAIVELCDLADEVTL